MGICGYDKPFEVEIQIIDHCNLNCNSCNHFSNISKEWYMSEIEFKFCLAKIKKELIPYGLKRIMILGGEPFLHPQLKEFCKYAHQLFLNTEINIDILTNGIILNTLPDEEIQEYKNMVGLIVTPYPHFKNSKVEKNNLILSQSRLFFIPNTVDDEGKQETTECKKQVLPCIFIRDYKVYMCPFAGTIHIYNDYCNKNIPITKNDYISIYELTFNKLQDFINEYPHHICKYCTNGAPIYWGINNYNEYKEIDPVNLFFKNYNEYNELFNGSLVLKNLDKKFINAVKSQASSEATVRRLNSRINGKLDIIIPYYTRTKKQFKKLYKTLINQKDIEKYHVYLISDNSPNEKEALKIFKPFDKKMNITHLKNSERMGPGAARQLAIDNSYNDYIFCLDSDDQLIEKDALSRVIEITEKENFDLLICKAKAIIEESKQPDIKKIVDVDDMNTHAWIYSREFLNKNNIRYKKYLISEDCDFTWQIWYCKPKIKYSDILLYQYNSTTKENLGHSTTVIDKLLWHNVMFFNKPNYLNDPNILINAWNTILMINFLEKDLKNYSNTQIKKMIPVGIGCAKIFYNALSEEDKQKLPPPKKDKGSIAKMVYNKVINNNDDINYYKNLIKNEINSSTTGKLLLPWYKPYLQ